MEKVDYKTYNWKLKDGSYVSFLAPDKTTVKYLMAQQGIVTKCDFHSCCSCIEDELEKRPYLKN